ncbi:PAS domain S-box protein [Azospirillum sp. SYSU D00513]|uniref:sensor histidine kinase n=1 Tax=Azospirillum sp. SYSU D00513 TaxID=2812561 RepID=UPI001A969106|nr:PAS domain S-box protein [Azospirillum sp. SYSU D00513]
MQTLHSAAGTTVATARAAGFAPLIDDSILELLPAAVYVCDRDGMILRYNRKAVELWGRAPRDAEFVGRFYASHRICGPDGRPLSPGEVPMMTALREGKPARNLELRMERPDGTALWVLVNIDPIRDGTGAVTGAVNCFQDITARKMAEAQARETQELLRAIVDTTPECVKIVAPDGALLYMNPAGLRMIGAERVDTVIGACAFDLIVPEHRDAWKERHARVCGGERISWEFDITALDGQRHHMETHAVPLRMPNRRVAHLAVTRDVSERRDYENRLRDSERDLRALLEALPAAVYTTDPDGRITFFNQAAIQLWGGVPDAETARWCGSHRLLTENGEPLPHGRSPMAEAVAENRPLRNREAMLERPDGSRVPILAYPTPLRDGAGRLSGAVNMLVDISERKQAEERQQLMINELNHRVKNTLATVQSIAYQTFGEETGESRRWFEGRLLALSEAHNVLSRENWEGADLRDIVRQAVAPMQDQTGQRFLIEGPGLRLTPKMALSLALALHELCTNAAKYGALTRAGGRVTIRWTVDEGKLALRWTEEGGPPVEQPRRKGFGTRLVTRGLAHELRASVRLDYPPTGATCSIDVELP